MSRCISTGRSVAAIGFKATLLAAALVCIGSATAFTVARFQPCVVGICPLVFHSDPNHESITTIALSPKSSSPFTDTLSDGSTTVEFESQAIAFVRESDADTDSAFWDLKYLHFDYDPENAGSLDKSLSWLTEARDQIGKRASSGNYQSAQELLGRALHTVQDFYAHTTWVEIGHTDLAPLGQIGQALPPVSSGATCSPSPTQTLAGHGTGLLAPIPFTHEYFVPSQAYDSAYETYWTDSAPSYLDQGLTPQINGLCIHGLSDRANSDTLGAGINKDRAFRDFYIPAFNLAVRATAQYVHDIIKDLRYRGDDAAICGLIGSAVCVSGTITSATYKYAMPNSQGDAIITVSGSANGPPGTVLRVTCTPDDINNCFELNGQFSTASCGIWDSLLNSPGYEHACKNNGTTVTTTWTFQTTNITGRGGCPARHGVQLIMQPPSNGQSIVVSTGVFPAGC